MGETCDLCNRSPVKTTEHHLIPKQYGGVEGPTVILCQACHRQIHVIFTNQELAGFYNTMDRLQDHPEIKKYLHWVKKQDPEKRISTSKPNHRKRK
ncbi:HNH endonuclease [Halobacillus litoralis]|uniref:HNH endonuclease n=1 Tax=Halobacillus litoralis TaxID=45668 RepID=A0A410MAA8_9BACI|nr:HNH endonuclease [Halobacillus litoralis]QAS51661.1 HNH endonuclease [Halobacillus litoralis]